MIRLGVKELAHIKSSVIKRAYEVTTLMLRVDNLIHAKEIAKFHKK
jgi:chaperonin GroEL (HSP60 family)